MMPMRCAMAKRGGHAWPSPMKRPNTVAALMRATAAEDQRVPHLFCQLARSIFPIYTQFYKWYHSFCKMKRSLYKMNDMVSFIL